MGASAVLAASPALAASVLPTSKTVEAVTVVWPTYHLAGPDLPRVGESVTLRPEREPFMKSALGIYSQRGLKLGYVAPRKAEKLIAALDRGARLDAQITAKRDDGALAEQQVSGWRAATLSVTTTGSHGLA